MNEARRLTIGMIGHVDHGKTALTRALTGMETDRLAEEQRRGISIALGFAYFTLDAASVDVIDMPGHERFVRTMIAGATGIDAALLVVAANEGIMPQTREHVDIAGLLGVRQAVVAVTKSDLAPPEICTQVGAEAVALARAAGMAVVTPIAVSAQTGAGLEALRRALAAVLAQAQPPEDCGFAWLPIDRAFSIAGHGTVVTGTLRRGVLRADDAIESLPAGTKLRIRTLQAHGVKVDQARPGQRVAVNLRAVEPSDLPRGMALATPGLLAPSLWLDISLVSVAAAPELTNGMRLVLLFGASEVDARLRLLDREALAPGETAFAQLRLETAIAAPARERFVLRLPSPAQTVAGGIILDPDSRRQRRHARGVLRRLAALAGATPPAILAHEIENAGAQGVVLARLARIAGLAPAYALPLLRALTPAAVFFERDSFVLAASAFETLIARLPRLLAPRPAGLSHEAFAAALPQASSIAIDAALDRLVATGVLRRIGGRFTLANAEREQAEAMRRHLEAVKLAELLRQAGLTPPEPWKLAPDPGRRQLLESLIREGVAIRAPDRVQKREFVFHRDAVAEAQRRLAPLLAGDGLLVSEIGAALGVSRKFSVPLLEYLDAIRFTRRIDDRRILAHPS
ncbi:MAG TPA: selenocysteine-specific translation elongation factor [Rhodoblastus sp.]|nr:selenocysteine-specific translation elongation factor [Rhodoblastus sp.]